MPFLVITPIGVILKLFRKEFLDLKFPRDVESYWIETGAKIGEDEGVESYENQF